MENPTNPAENEVLELDPYKQMEFEKFLEILQSSPVNNWSIVATVLGVDRETILRWRKHPRAREILIKALQETIENMEESGAADWRMWREKAKLLGVDDVQTVELTGSVGGILDKLDTKYDELGRKAEGQVVAPEPPVQDQG